MFLNKSILSASLVLSKLNSLLRRGILTFNVEVEAEVKALAPIMHPI